MPKYNKNSAQSITKESLVAFSKTYQRMLKKLLPVALEVLEFKAKNASTQTLSEQDFMIFRISRATAIQFKSITKSNLVVSVEFYGTTVMHEYDVPLDELVSNDWKEDFVAKEALLKAKEATLSRKQKKAN